MVCLVVTFENGFMLHSVRVCFFFFLCKYNMCRVKNDLIFATVLQFQWYGIQSTFDFNDVINFHNATFAFRDAFPSASTVVYYWRSHSIAQQSSVHKLFAGCLQENQFSFKRHLIKLFFTDIASVAFYDPYKIKIFHSIWNM